MKINRKSRIMNRTRTERSNGATNLNLRPWSSTSTWSDNDAWLTTMAIWHLQHGYINRCFSSIFCAMYRRIKALRFQALTLTSNKSVAQQTNSPPAETARNANIWQMLENAGDFDPFWLLMQWAEISLPNVRCFDYPSISSSESSLLLQIWWWRKARLKMFEFCKFSDFLAHLRCHGVISASVHQHATSVKTWCIR